MIHLGYEIGTGRSVEIPLRHMAVTGQTQESGKTTTLEAIITRSGLCAVAFITKRGEKSFRLARAVPIYFREPADTAATPLWRWIEAIFETVGESIGKEERAAIIQASAEILEREKYETGKRITRQLPGEKKARRVPETKTRLHSTGRRVKSLAEVAENVRLMLGTARGKVHTALTCLDAYFKIVLPQIADLGAVPKLDLAPGVNVMDLESLSDEMQMLVIRSVIEEVYRARHSIVVIVPEANKFIPRRRQSPVRLIAEMYIRQGLGIGNVLMIDAQDLADVATEVLKSIGVWILGKQGEINEVKRVVDYIPAIPKIERQAIMQLGRGEFYVVCADESGRVGVKKAYVQPAGMEDAHAQAIAMGEESADSWKRIVRQLDAERDQALEYVRQVAEMPVPDLDQQPIEGGDADAAGITAATEATPGGAPSPAETETSAETFERGAGSGNDAAGLHAGDDGNRDGDDEAMWKEKYEALTEKLTAILDKLSGPLAVEFHQSLLEMGVIPTTAPHLPDPAAACPPTRADLANAEFRNSKTETFGIAGFTDAGYAALKARLLADPGVLMAIAAAQPTMEIAITRPKLEIEGTSVKGRIGLLIREKFFERPRKVHPDVLAEFKRRGWFDQKSKGGSILTNPISQIAEDGFLTLEPDGYQAAPGMKVTVKEA